MALTRAQKAVQLQELKEKMQKSQSVIFANYIGLTVAEVSDLRRKLRAAGAEMKVAKKTLMCLAAKELRLPEPGDDTLTGAVACIFNYTDPVAGAQVALQYAKDHPQVAFVSGIYEGKLLSRAETKMLAGLPNRLTLLAIFAGMLRSPLRQFAGICHGSMTSFARAVNELAKQKASAPAA
ncbi:MAG: large subunit ribosomal protein L10 [Candidatus Peregrinibacteria bacterium Greene0416_19]|nr:MAG: large subunit ribosomal protein L10 [Candidatus Peregrinibacteria bacterium Greene0416_19]